MNRQCMAAVYTKGVVGIGLLSLALFVTGCDDGLTAGGGSSLPMSTPTVDQPGVIADNHGHSVVLTAADQDAGLDVALRLTGGGHGHLLYLGWDQVVAVATGGVAQATSLIVMGHDHLVTFGTASQGQSGNTNSVPATPSGSHTNKTGIISVNHGHTAVLTGAEQDAGQAVTLNLTAGAGGHTHVLFLDASQVNDAASGALVGATTSMVLGHDHVVTFQ